MKEGEFLVEPHYNAALWAFKSCEYQDAFELVSKALKIYPEHDESKRLKKDVEEMLTVL
jgi:hypothetical protein